MTTKRIGVRKAGEGSVIEMDINENTTAGDVLTAVGCPTSGDFFVTLGSGQPAMGLTEKVFDRVHEGGKLFVYPKADAGR